MVQIADPKIEEALDLINKSAKEKGDQLKYLINKRYYNIREVMSALSGEPERSAEFAAKAAGGNMSRMMTRTKDTISDMGERSRGMVRKNPWTILGSVAAGFLAIGYVLGNTLKLKR